MCFYARRYGGLGAPGLPGVLTVRLHRQGGAARGRGGHEGAVRGLRVHVAARTATGSRSGRSRSRRSRWCTSAWRRSATGSAAGGVLFAYSGDGGPSDNLVEVARDADLFLCEATYQEATSKFPFHLQRPAGGRACDEGGREAVDAHAHRPDARPGGVGRRGLGGVRRSRLGGRGGHGRGDHGVTRPDGRANDELRPVAWELGYQEWAAGSVLLSMGKTRVLIAASVSEDAPRWLKGTGKGWVTGEYSMLPASTNERSFREVNKGRPGRAHAGDPTVDRALAALRDGSGEAGGADRSRSTVTSCRPTRARAPRRSPAGTSRWRSRSVAWPSAASSPTTSSATASRPSRWASSTARRGWTSATRRTRAPTWTSTW